MKIKTPDLELAVVRLLDPRANTIVPNVYWGLGLSHECDLLVLDKQQRFSEVELKVSKQDLKADLRKNHGHQSNLISRLIYAMPEDLIPTALDILPLKVGIIAVKPVYINNTLQGYSAKWIRPCKHNKLTKPPDQKTIEKFLHLGCMRIWTLKHHLNKKRK